MDLNMVAGSASCYPDDTFDGRNLANQLRLVVYPSFFYIPGGSLGFLPSTVWSPTGPHMAK